MYAKELPNKLNVGILAATALGSELTQQNLDAFHSVGNTSDLLTSGSQRIEECLNNSATFKKIIVTVNKNKKDIEKYIFTNLGKLIHDVEVVGDFNNLDWKNVAEKKFGELPKDFDNFLYFKIKIFLGKQIFYDYFVDKNLKMGFEDNRDFLDPIFIAYSPYLINSDNLLYNEVLMAFNFDNNFNEMLFDQLNYFCPKQNMIKYMIENVYKKKISNYKLFGIDYVEEIIEKNSKSIIICNPSVSVFNLIKIDPENILINKTQEMFNIFGIEVAKKCLIDELCEIMPKILKCHIELLISFITLKGTIKSVNRYANRSSKDWLKRIGFEEPLRNIIFAAINNETDYLETISSRIISSKKI